MKSESGCSLSPSLRLGKVFSSNSQTLSNKTFLSKRFRYWVFLSFKIKQSDYVLLNRVWFGPKKSFGFFQTWYSSRFSADAHRHQVYFGLSFKQVGLWYIHPLSFGSSPPLSRLIRRYSSPSTSLPLCAPNSFGESLLCFYIWSIADYLLCRSLWEESPEIQVLSTSGGSLLMRR